MSSAKCLSRAKHISRPKYLTLRPEAPPYRRPAPRRLAPLDRPLLMSGPMVCATLNGLKTHTRRVIPPDWWRCVAPEDLETPEDWAPIMAQCPYGVPGTTLWVREAFGLVPSTAYGANVPHRINPNDPAEAAIYRADWQRVWDCRLRPSIHMPRWASRLTLEVLSVRAERLQSLTWADIRAEGVQCPEHDFGNGGCCSECPALRAAFVALWDGLNGERGFSYASNPWVWDLGYRQAEQL